MKKLLFIALVTLTAACFPQATIVVTNDCPGTWFNVSKTEGMGHHVVVTDHLTLGNDAVVSLRGESGAENHFVITIKGYRTDNNQFFGTAERGLYVGSYDGGSTGPRNNDVWRTSELMSGRCPTSGG